MKKAVFLFDFTNIMAKPWADAGYLCYCFDGQHPQGVSKSGHENILNVGMWFEVDGIYDVNNNDIEKIKQITGDDVVFVFGFPECTDLAVSGAAHFAKKKAKDPRFQFKAMQLVNLVKNLGDDLCCSWALENPISVISSMWRKPDFMFHPWEFGGYLPEDDKHPEYPEYIKARDAYPKKTCIWHGNGFVKPNKKEVGPNGWQLIEGNLGIPNPEFETHPCHFNERGHRIDSVVMKRKYPGYDCDGLPIWGYSDQHKKLGGKSLKTKNIRSATPRGFAQAVFESNGLIN